MSKEDQDRLKREQSDSWGPFKTAVATTLLLIVVVFGLCAGFCATI